MRKCAAIGVIVRDERKRPNGQKVWSAPHLHLEIGARTDEKLREFQKRNGLTADGIVGAQTLAALAALG